MANIYTSSARYAAVAQWTAVTAYVSTANGGRGDYVRQLAAPAVGSERVFRCTTSGTSLAAEPTWNLTKNATTAEAAGPTWTECTGQEADQVSGTWKAPHARKANALAATWSVAGDVYYTGDDHAETQAAAMTHTYPGTLASPNMDVCVSVTGTVPPVSTDLRGTAGARATVTTTGNNAMTIAGCSYIYGTTYSCGTTAASPTFALGGTVQTDLLFDSSAIQIAATTSPALQIGTSSNSIGTKIVWNNTTYQCGSATQVIFVERYVDFLWRNTASAVSGATLPTNLFGVSSNTGGDVVCLGIDLSALSSKTLVQAIARGGIYTFAFCKLPATYTACGTPTTSAATINLIACSSAASPYILEKRDARGTQTSETTIIRTTGAIVGGTAVAMKIVTTTAAHLKTPFISTPLRVTNTLTGTNRTVTVYGIWGGGAVPNNDDVSMFLGYLGSSSTPQWSFQSLEKADVLAANTALTTDGSTWGGSTTAFKMTLTLSAPQPQLVGDMYVYVQVHAASTTVYLDPIAWLS